MRSYFVVFLLAVAIGIAASQAVAQFECSLTCNQGPGTGLTNGTVAKWANNCNGGEWPCVCVMYDCFDPWLYCSGGAADFESCGGGL